jgi:hypothetical protein
MNRTSSLYFASIEPAIDTILNTPYMANLIGHTLCVVEQGLLRTGPIICLTSLDVAVRAGRDVKM